MDAKDGKDKLLSRPHRQLGYNHKKHNRILTLYR